MTAVILTVFFSVFQISFASMNQILSPFILPNRYNEPVVNPKVGDMWAWPLVYYSEGPFVTPGCHNFI